MRSILVNADAGFLNVSIIYPGWGSCNSARLLSIHPVLGSERLGTVVDIDPA
jgi:hypothetical protein